MRDPSPILKGTAFATSDAMPEFGFLKFLADPTFVAIWYGVGLLCAITVGIDELKQNSRISLSSKATWPLLIFFTSLPGLALYLFTGRPPTHAAESAHERRRRQRVYFSRPFRATAGCVARWAGGGSVGIITAMVIARYLGLGFWGEFWLEYLGGLLTGCVLLSLGHGKSLSKELLALLLSGRAALFAVSSLMVGVGVINGYVMPLVVGEQVHSTTAAFWGFAALGLLAGFLLSYPMNWMLARIGWTPGAR